MCFFVWFCFVLGLSLFLHLRVRTRTVLPESHLIHFEYRMAAYFAHVRIVFLSIVLDYGSRYVAPKSRISFFSSTLINTNPETPKDMMPENP